MMERAWYLTTDDRYLVEKSSWRDSLVVKCFANPDEARAKALVSGAVAQPVGEVWPFARRVASAGCSAILLVEDDDEIALPLLAPAHDPLTPRPTHVELSRTPTQTVALGRRGLRAYVNWEYLTWSRYDLLDPTTAAAQRSDPVPGWTSGEPLYELQWHGDPVCVRTSQLLGPFASTDGVMVYCSSLAESHRMAARMQPDDYLTVATASTGMPTFDLGLGFTAVEVRDITSRLHDLDQQSRMYAVNPSAPRHEAGWGLAFAPETLHTVSGLWTWLPANQLDHEEDRYSWSGYDTCHYDGGVRESLRGGSVSFRSVLPLSDAEDLAPADYEDAVAEMLATPWARPSDSTLRADEPQSLDDFMLVGWNLATGEHSLLYFRDVLEACQWLLAYEGDIEVGLHLHWLPGHDPGGREEKQHDDSGSVLLGRSLERLCTEFASRGYVPQDAGRLVGIANHNLRTLHLHYAGYFKDAAYDCSDEPYDLARLSTGFDFPAVLRWLENAEPPVAATPHRAPVLDDIWAHVTPRSRSCLFGAFTLREDHKGLPNWDAAPLVMQICKAVEVQLRHIFQRVVSTLDPGTAEPANPADQKLLNFARGSGTLELGSMGSLLKGPKAGPLTEAFRGALADAGGSAMLARSFGRALTDLTANFRNPAVHESRFSYDEAEELWSRWLTDADGPARYRSLTAPQLPDLEEIHASSEDDAGVDIRDQLLRLRFIARRRELSDLLYERLSQALWTSSKAWDAAFIAGLIVMALEEHRLQVPSLPPADRKELRSNQALRRGIAYLTSRKEAVFVVRLMTALEDQLQRCVHQGHEMPYQATVWTLLTLLSGPNSPSRQLMQEVTDEVSPHLAAPPRGPFVGRLPDRD